MTVNGWLQILAFCAVLIAVSPFLGRYMAKVYSGENVFLSPVFGPVELQAPPASSAPVMAMRSSASRCGLERPVRRKIMSPRFWRCP